MRRHAFTLIEMLVVCAVLGMIAGLVIPNVVSMKAGRERDEAYKKLLRLAQEGRETAIQSGHTYTMTLANGGRAVEINRDEATEVGRDGANGPSTATTVSATTTPQIRLPGSGAAFTSRSETSGGSNDPNADGDRAELPEGATVGNVVLGDKSSTTTDFTLHFYPDGRSEGGGLEIAQLGATRSLSVDRNGFATLKDGTLPPTTESSWEAGQYEQRASG